MRISMIAAASENNVIGVDNDLPWRLPDDMKFFKQTTMGHYVVTGRKNIESFGRLLPNRPHIVLTRQADYQFGEATVISDPQKAIEIAKTAGEEELFIIGGGEIYNIYLEQADRIYLTRVHTEIEGHAFFPELNLAQWEEISSEYHPKDERHPFDFTIKVYDRKA